MIMLFKLAQKTEKNWWQPRGYKMIPLVPEQKIPEWKADGKNGIMVNVPECEFYHPQHLTVSTIVLFMLITED